jgi:hypothetical protein
MDTKIAELIKRAETEYPKAVLFDEILVKLVLDEVLSRVRPFTCCDIDEDRLGSYSSGYLKCAEDILEELKFHFGIKN